MLLAASLYYSFSDRHHVQNLMTEEMTTVILLRAELR